MLKKINIKIIKANLADKGKKLIGPHSWVEKKRLVMSKTVT
jgi:hypothetical protein